MSTSATDHTHPYYQEISKLHDPVKFFTGKNSNRLQHVSLGEALDFVSFGGLNYVIWPPFDRKGMIEYIQSWMENQKPKIEYERVPITEHSYSYLEKSKEYNYLWNRFHDDFPEELPYIKGTNCSNEGHIKTVKDSAGRVRCANKNAERFKPSFVRSFVNGNRIQYYEDKPQRPSDDDGDEQSWRSYEREIAQFEQEQPSFEVGTICYSIISDEGTNLSLESILSRLSVTHSFTRGSKEVFPFSGIDLANYVKVWWNQPGEKQFFLPEGRTDNYKVYPKFQPISSDD